MHPISFPQQNKTLVKPEEMTEEQCLPLPTHHYEQVIGFDEEHQPIKFPAIISCWKLTPEEHDEIQRTGIVWVNTLGETLAPFSVFTKNPFNIAESEPK